MYLQRFTAKFCSLKIWIKLKIENTEQRELLREVSQIFATLK
ncbi:hypothetical protein EC253486_5142 [Escherichia coli 2534-86]|nr:hypothetical protein EC253486_5142 [Escherichia coli 2534-86]